jgi:hypothetical protein
MKREREREREREGNRCFNNISSGSNGRGWLQSKRESGEEAGSNGTKSAS